MFGYNGKVILFVKSDILKRKKPHSHTFCYSILLQLFYFLINLLLWLLLDRGKVVSEASGKVLFFDLDGGLQNCSCTVSLSYEFIIVLFCNCLMLTKIFIKETMKFLE